MDTATIKSVLTTILDYIRTYTEQEVKEDQEQAELQTKYQNAVKQLESMTKDSQELANLVTELQTEIEKLKATSPSAPSPNPVPVEPVPTPVPPNDTVPGA